MFFEYQITVPKNTSERAPLVTEKELKVGIIHQFEAVPWGYSVDMLRCRVERGLHSIFPTDGSDYFAFNGQPIAGRVHQPIDTAPYTIKIIAWNLSTLYPHSFTLRIWLLPEEVLNPTPSIFSQFRSWFEQLIHPGR